MKPLLYAALAYTAHTEGAPAIRYVLLQRTLFNCVCVCDSTQRYKGVGLPTTHSGVATQ